LNLAKLFEMQRQLDERIEREHPRQEGEDRLAKKILALLVELGELANEARFFKYWSHDQKPRIVVREWKLYEDTIKEYGDSTHRRYEGVVRPVLRQPLLEEYVDCLHFILSIGTDLYNGLYHDGNFKFDYEFLLLQFIHLGEMLGFTWSEIEQAYLEKNQVNHRRQDSNY